MSDPSTEPGGAIATAEPPAKPPAPPSTAAAAHGPGRKRRVGCWVSAILLLVVAILGLGVWWLVARTTQAKAPLINASAFDSAMTKAMVKSPGAPPAPIDLSTVKSRGTHAFDATFSADELTALLNAFPHPVDVGNASVALSGVNLGLGPQGEITLAGTVASGGTAYSGKVSGPVAYTNGQVVASGPLTVEAEGLTLGGSQAQTATRLLLAYVNGYLAAAPGLTITGASVTPTGVHVKGLAPDSISY